ncbi:killer cell immunoglobulin-like receptor 2DL4 isoform 2-T2 [Dama dama]
MVEIGGLHTTDQLPWMRVQGAWGPSGQAISDGLFLLGFCVSLRIWAAVGEFEKPSLSAWPSPVVPLGQTVTLQCYFRSPLKRFRLFKADGTSLSELRGNHFNNFTLGPVTREHAGSYTCSGFSRFLLLLPRQSDPLHIVVTGVFKKPAISAHPGPLVQEGRNVTLRCQSQLLFDKFILHQENSTGHFQTRGETFTGGHSPADFFIGPMTLARVGTYRCYGSLSRSPYEWSAPSDPVDIVITESTASTCPSTMKPHTTEEAKLPQGYSSQLHLLLRLSVAFIYTSIFLAVLVCHWFPKKCCHHGRRAPGRQNSERQGRCLKSPIITENSSGHSTPDH